MSSISPPARVRIVCPGCSAKLQVDRQPAARTVTCPACKAPIMVPGESPSVEVAVLDRQPGLSLRTKLELAAIAALFLGVAGWLGLRGSFSKPQSVEEQLIEDYRNRELAELTDQTDQLQERKAELQRTVESLRQEVATLDRQIEQTLSTSKATVDEIVTAFQQGKAR